jgi:polysaccharide chain length determinant protein (PEP-CTERM system associated)
MQELIAQAEAAARGMWKYRWWGVAVAWVVAAVGTVVVFLVPNQYEASARIQVDTQSILKPLMAGLAVQPDIDQQVSMLSRTLISRPNVEKLVRMADLDLAKRSKPEQDVLVDNVMKALRINSTGRDNLYVLSYRDNEPERARRAVQSLVSIFVESGLGASRKDAESARAFINEQIKNYQAKLEEAESRLKEFRLRNLDLQVGEGRDVAARLTELNNQLERAKLELREAENARDAAKASLDGEKTQGTNLLTQSLMQESAISVATPEIDARIEVQRRNLDSLLQRFTDQHPEVLSTRRLLQDLEEQKRKDVQVLRKAALSAPPSLSGGSSSLASQELQRMVAMSEVQVASLKARVSEYSSRLAQARQSLKNAPQLEAEAAQLNRDYAIHKKNYEDLVARRESANMSGDLDVASGIADFRLIDPPRVAPQPVFPNRFMLLPLVLLGSLAAGAAATFAMSQARPVFFHPREMLTKLETPILGMVSAVVTGVQARRRRIDQLRFGFATGGLVALFVAGLSIMSLVSQR